MDDKEMIATLRLMSKTHDGDKARVRWTWDETRKGRTRLIEDWPDETPVIALEAKRWKGCLPAPYIAEMHNNLPRLLELAEAGMRVDAPSAAVEAELRARQEQINALTAEKHALENVLDIQGKLIDDLAAENDAALLQRDIYRIAEAAGLPAMTGVRDIIARIEKLRAVTTATARSLNGFWTGQWWERVTEAVRALNEDEARDERAAGAS